jgi:hypothetical protein
MRIISVLVFLACAHSSAQVIMNGTGGLQDTRVRFETRIEPELPGQEITAFGGGMVVAPTGFHRYMTDSTTKKYFGYDLSIEPEPGEMFQVSFHLLSLSAKKLGLELPVGWTPLAMPRLPQPQMVRAGDTIVLDLLTQTKTGQKIVDYLFIQEDEHTVRLPSGEPRDYTADDVPLVLNNLRMTVNGRAVEQGGSFAGTAGFFYLAGHGRFAFTLAPNQELGFRKAGEVRGNTLTFAWGGDTFVLACDGSIAPGGGVFNLYAYRDDAWRPPAGSGTFFFGAGSARSIVRH